jgi:hypothetical protein
MGILAVSEDTLIQTNIELPFYATHSGKINMTEGTATSRAQVNPFHRV